MAYCGLVIQSGSNMWIRAAFQAYDFSIKFVIEQNRHTALLKVRPAVALRHNLCSCSSNCVSFKWSHRPFPTGCYYMMIIFNAEQKKPGQTSNLPSRTHLYSRGTDVGVRRGPTFRVTNYCGNTREEGSATIRHHDLNKHTHPPCYERPN